MRQLSFLLLLVCLVSCKTTEEIKREKLVESMNDQLSQGQKLSVDNQTKIQELEERLAQLTGKLEEKKHGDESKLGEGLKDLNERMRLIEEKNASLEASLKEQKEYLGKLLQAIQKGAVPTEKKNKEKASSEEDGLALYKAGKFAKAEPLLAASLDEKNLKGEKKAQTLHALGTIAFKNKKYEDAAVYMSRLYTEHPKSKLIPSALLTLGKSLQASGDKGKARAAFEQIETDFPKSPEATQAKEHLKVLAPASN